MKVWKRLVPILAITSLMIAAKPSISAGSNTTTGNHTVGITTSGEAYACGYNRSGPDVTP